MIEPLKFNRNISDNTEESKGSENKHDSKAEQKRLRKIENDRRFR